MVDPDKLYVDFGQRMREARRAQGMTQEDLSRKIGLVRASVANIEVGRQKVLLHTFLDICDSVGLGPATALGITSSEALFSASPRPHEVERIKEAIHDYTQREIARLNR